MYSSRASCVKMPARTSCIFLASLGGSAKVFRLSVPVRRGGLEDAASFAFRPRLDGDFFELLGEAGSSASGSSSASAARAFSPLWIWWYDAS